MDSGMLEVTDQEPENLSIERKYEFFRNGICWTQSCIHGDRGHFAETTLESIDYNVGFPAVSGRTWRCRRP